MSEGTSSHGLGALTGLHEAIARLEGKAALGFAALLGVFSALAFAPFHLTPTLAVSLTGLVWMLDGARGRQKWGQAMFLRGWAFGVGVFLVSMYWTAMPFLVEPERHAVFLWLPLIVLPAGLGAIWGLAIAIGGAFWSSSPSRVFVFAAVMGGAELVRGGLFGGFPWNLAGTSWVPGGAMSQLVSIGGVYWLTMMTLFVMAAPAALVDTRAHHGVLGRSLPAILAVALIGFGWAWGAQRLTEEVRFTDKTVLMMDAGIPQDQKAARNGHERTLARYVSLMRDVQSAPGDIMIWPEGALRQPLLTDPQAMDLISAFLNGRVLVVGTVRYSRLESGLAAYNSLAVLRQGQSAAELVGLYDKHRLVPFGELPAVRIVPFAEFFAGLLPEALQMDVNIGFTAGSQPTVLLPQDTMPPFIPLICYEGLFPEMVRKAQPQRDKAEWIIGISNDSWFGAGLGPAQHYAQHRYRAIESGLPMARVATRGITAMVDGFGREVDRGRPVYGDPDGWRSSVARVPLPEALPTPPFQRFGPTFYWLSLLCLGGFAFLSWRR